MKTLITLICLLSATARAEMYMNCKISALPVPSLTNKIPQTIEIDEAGDWYFTADGNEQKDAYIYPVENTSNIKVEYRRVEAGTDYDYQYTFDASRCDQEGIGKAKLTKTMAPGQSPKKGASKKTTEHYLCECAID
jgi:hypothetical protein